MAERKLDLINVVDVESTCWRGKPPPGEVSEIIEVGLVPLNIETLEIGDTTSQLIVPQHSKITEFSISINHITPDMVEKAPAFPEAMAKLREEHSIHRRTWASWGDYDRKQFERMCEIHHLQYPFWRTHLNIKNLFSLVMGFPMEYSVAEALDWAELEFEGTPHRGGDDAHNIAKLLQHLLKSARIGRVDANRPRPRN